MFCHEIVIAQEDVTTSLDKWAGFVNARENESLISGDGGCMRTAELTE